MKTKIHVDLHKRGEENSAVLRMIAANNEGTENVTQEHIKGYLLHRKIEYPSLYKGLITSSNLTGETLHISEDNGKTFTISLMWADVYELQPESNEIDNAAKLAETVLNNSGTASKDFR